MFQELVRQAKSGDKAAKEEIIKRLQPLLVSSIKRYYFNKNELEDLMQEGNLKILEAINSYDQERGVYFLGYIKTQLKYMYLDKHKQRRHTSLNEKAGNGKDEIVDLLIDEDQAALDAMVSEEAIGEMRQALKKLTKRQREISILFYIEKLSMADIADKLGVSYRTVVNTKKTALDKLRQEMEREKPLNR